MAANFDKTIILGMKSKMKPKQMVLKSDVYLYLTIKLHS